MKKVVIILGMVFTVGLLSSCTDNSLNDIENNEKQFIDKNDTVNPGGSGQGQDDDNGEG